MARGAAGGVGDAKAIRGGPSLKRRALSIAGLLLLVLLSVSASGCTALGPPGRHVTNRSSLGAPGSATADLPDFDRTLVNLNP